MKVQKFNKEQFLEFCKQINTPKEMNLEYLFNAYCEAVDGANEMVESNMFGKLIPINSVVILLYLVNEYSYFLYKKDFKEDEETTSKIVSFTLDKYFTNEHLNYKNVQFTNKFSITISTLEIYLNLMLGVLEKFPRNNPKETLLVDFANKCLKLCKAISQLITSGFETEAFSTWRTLHETECILMIVSKYGDKVIKSYLKHMNYAIAFRGGGASKEETDKIFIQIKDEMKALDLKSKDMKKFIEYGWLTATKDYTLIEGFKFNFRDGVEQLAGLKNYSKVYEMASEIAHSSPLLIYSKNKYFYYLTILQLYESFFRIEKIFCSIYLKNVSDEERKRYMLMREVYYPTLIDIYKIEQANFALLNKKK